MESLNGSFKNAGSHAWRYQSLFRRIILFSHEFYHVNVLAFLKAQHLLYFVQQAAKAIDKGKKPKGEHRSENYSRQKIVSRSWPRWDQECRASPCSLSALYYVLYTLSPSQHFNSVPLWRNLLLYNSANRLSWEAGLRNRKSIVISGELGILPACQFP